VRCLAVAALAHALVSGAADLRGAEEEPAPPEPPAPPLIPWTSATDHIGEEVTVEGRIVATHASPLATILSFEKNFNRFTAVIRPADRDAFPPDPEEYYRDKWVRVSGRIGEYGQKAEIVLRSPRQIAVLPSPAPAAPAAESAVSGELATELLRRLTAIEEGLQQVADRLELLLAALTETAPQPARETGPRLLPGRMPRVEPPPRPAYERLRRVKRGMTADQVAQLAGEPLFVDVSSEGGETWYYGAGSSITFNARGRVESFVGFQRP
jgi:hypothetical protein